MNITVIGSGYFGYGPNTSINNGTKEFIKWYKNYI